MMPLKKKPELGPEYDEYDDLFRREMDPRWYPYDFGGSLR